MQISKHRALVMWQVGNELNGAWNEYVCDDAYATKFLHAPCTFGDNAAKLCEFIDDMCQLVRSQVITPCIDESVPAGAFERLGIGSALTLTLTLALTSSLALALALPLPLTLP